MAEPLHIGLIGGIGPAATVAYYQRLTSQMRARKAKLELTIVNADVGALLRNTDTDDRSAQAEVYKDLIDRLKSAGADCVAITSLGGHFCFNETVAVSALPLISAIAPLDAYFQREGIDTVGLLGTDVVMRTKLYGQLAETTAVAPQHNLEKVADTYRNMAFHGLCSDADRTLFLEEGQRMVEDQGADAIVLAGTDLGLAFDGQDTSYRVIDALDVHVAVLADLACGTRALT